ncbi:MAG: tyrosine--tRNA ligase [Candidatus Levybacteria bacterium]|nr:tyrosine--tRNA ligase [Candidatus Levybacteria bacterium]
MDKIGELLTRGVEKIYPSKEELEKALRSGRKLKLYQGFDPTGIQLHIGHMVGLRKLRQWQDLGHHVIFLIGDGTGLAGDPSGKKHKREKFLTREELRKNSTDYIKQAGKIVRFEEVNPVEILFNGDWLTKLILSDILEIAGHFTLQQLSERDLFTDRIKRGEDVNLREFLYPLLQAYDSVAMDVDLEIGGTDQTFNMLCGRSLIKQMKNKDKFVMTTPLLTDSKGVKIGKTEGNVIALTDKPEDLFGKIMALPDDVTLKGFEYLTSVPMDEVKKIEQKMDSMSQKKRLAFEIVKELNSDNEAKKAQIYFEKTVQEKEKPSEIKAVELPTSFTSSATIAEVLNAIGTVSSISEGKRVTIQGGTSINDQRITDPNEPIYPFLKTGEALVQTGKHKFVKIITTPDS